MKTVTYARLSLIIPLLLWVLSLPPLLIATAASLRDISLDQTESFASIVFGLLTFYVFGIIFWLLPYLLVAAFLLLLSFKSSFRILLYAYLLSPFAMAAMMFLEGTVIILSAYFSYSTQLLTDLSSGFLSIIGAGGVFAVFSLIFGYICVGLGFAGYKLLQQFKLLKDEEKSVATPVFDREPVIKEGSSHVPKPL